ncbi:MAG: hypothetical protein AB1Z98_38315, partial [Nannocystaceae bacterium]
GRAMSRLASIVGFGFGSAAVLSTLGAACQLETGGAGTGTGTSTSPSPTGSTDPTSTTAGPEATSMASMSGSATDPTTNGGTTSSVDPEATTTSEGDTMTDSGPPDPSTSDSGTPSDCTPILAEALTNLDRGDNGREWVVLYNPCDEDFDLSPLTLAWGQYAYDGTFDLSGTIGGGDCLVVGGPTSNAGNFNPPLGQVNNYEPNLSRNPGAIGLFLLPPREVDADDIPLDAVIYGTRNGGDFRDSSGAVPGPMIANPPDLQSMRRTSAGNTWEAGDPPTPSACPSF